MNHTIEQAKRYKNVAWFLFACGVIFGMGYKILADKLGCDDCPTLGYVGTFIGTVLVIIAFVMLRKSNKITKSLQTELDKE